MAQIVLIKNVTTSLKHVDDYIGVYESDHVFSTLELTEYTILQVEGIERADLAEFMRVKRPETKRIYRSTAANQWVDSIDKRTAWQDGTDWKMMEKDPKYQFSFSDVTEKDREDLANPGINPTVKYLILGKAVSRVGLEPENNVILSIAARL